jgi:hypothetical protein
MLQVLYPNLSVNLQYRVPTDFGSPSKQPTAIHIQYLACNKRSLRRCQVTHCSRNIICVTRASHRRLSNNTIYAFGWPCACEAGVGDKTGGDSIDRDALCAQFAGESVSQPM